MKKLLCFIRSKKNQLVNTIICIYDKKTNYVKILLPITILFLSFWLFRTIMEPIKFEKEKDYRYSFIKQKLIDIRSAELAYKEKNGYFTSEFDKLITFVKLDSFIIVERTDTLIEYYNDIYREYQFKDTILIDTLGKVSILDSLFKKNYPIDSLNFVPFGNGVEFNLSAGTINKSKITVPVFEAKDPKPFDPKEPLVIGSMFEAHLNGNWQ